MDLKHTHTTTNRPGDFKGGIIPYANRWYVFLISLIICVAIMWLYLDYVTPQYRITSTLQIPDDKKGDGILKATAFSDLNMFQETKTVDNEMEILRSKDLIYSVLKKLNLGASYFYKTGEFKTKELYGEELPVKIDIIKLNKNTYLKELELENINDSTFELHDGLVQERYNYGQEVKHGDYAFKVTKGPAFLSGPRLVTVKFNNLTAMAAAYSAGRLMVTPVIKESNTIILTLNDPVPARGVDILANIISVYNAENVQKKNTIAVNTILFIENRLKSMEQDLSYTEGDIETYKKQNSAEDASSGAQINLTKSAEYSQLLGESNAQLGIVNSIETYLDNSNNQFNAVPSSMGLTDPVLNNLITRFNDLQLERNRMLRSANLSNPLVQNLSDQIATLRVNIRENLGNIKKGFTIQHNLLAQNYARYDSRIRAVPSLERGLLQRGREQGVKTALYQYLLQKREETALSLSATIPSAQIVDKPSFDPAPSYPKKQLMYLCSSIFGLLIPGLFIFTRQHLNIKVKTTAVLKEITGARILGELTHNAVKGQIAVQYGSKSMISELFRYIRTNLDALNQDSHNKVMLVTSCMQGEGKTFVSINLGLTLALLNKKVLLVEFDLRKPDLLKKMGLTQKTGIADFLQGDVDDLEDSIQPYAKSDSLYVLGCGSLPKNPAELLMSPRVDELFDRLKDQFDYIIIDTSPVGRVADAFSLARHADLSIYLVRYNYTNVGQLEILRDIYENEKLKNPMVIFNDAKKENRPAYGYGGYGYA